MEQIPQTFANSQETETILAPVIQAGIQALKVRKTISFLLVLYLIDEKLFREPIVPVKYLSFQQRCRLQ